MKKGVSIMITILFLAFSCNEEPFNDSFELNKQQSFIPGVTYHLKNSDTTFYISGVDDSRCPTGATCVWAGMVQTDLVFQSSTTDTLRINTYNNPSDTIENYVFELMEVEPYPQLNKEIKVKDYRITLRITELNN